MFRFLAQIARRARPDASLFFVAALLALWAMPMANQAVFAANPPSVEAVLLLLSAEANAPRTAHLGAPTAPETPRTAAAPPLLASVATAHLGAFAASPPPETPQTIRARRTHDLSATVIARLSGVQTQVRLN